MTAITHESRPDWTMAYPKVKSADWMSDLCGVVRLAAVGLFWVNVWRKPEGHFALRLQPKDELGTRTYYSCELHKKRSRYIGSLVVEGALQYRVELRPHRASGLHIHFLPDLPRGRPSRSIKPPDQEVCNISQAQACLQKSVGQRARIAAKRANLSHGGSRRGRSFQAADQPLEEISQEQACLQKQVQENVEVGFYRWPVEIVVMLALARFADQEGGSSCSPPLETLAQRCQRSRRTVCRVLNQFEKQGWIAIQHTGRENEYRILPHGHV